MANQYISSRVTRTIISSAALIWGLFPWQPLGATHDAISDESAGPCAALASEYAASVVFLEQAQDAADNAYAAWHQCEYGEQPSGEGACHTIIIPSKLTCSQCRVYDAGSVSLGGLDSSGD